MVVELNYLIKLDFIPVKSSYYCEIQLRVLVVQTPVVVCVWREMLSLLGVSLATRSTCNYKFRLSTLRLPL